MEGPKPEAPSGLFMFRQFLRDPRIASVKSTSPYLVRRICRRLDLARARVVVEFGPGLGCFTRALLERLSPGAVLVLIESNPEFARRLHRFREPRVRIVRGSAEQVAEILRALGLPKADVVLSGIPFSLFSEPRTLRLLEDVQEVLADGGTFVAYQSSARLEKCLKRVFGRVRVEREVFHIPPLVVLEACSA